MSLQYVGQSADLSGEHSLSVGSTAQLVGIWQDETGARKFVTRTVVAQTVGRFIVTVWAQGPEGADLLGVTPAVFVVDVHL